MAFSSTLPHYVAAQGKAVPFDYFTTLLANDNALQSDPTTMAWYAVGSFTPVIGGAGGTSGQTYASQVGAYIKIGRLVLVTFRAALTATGTITGAVQIQGLPFASDNVTNLNSNTTVRFDSLATNWIHVHARLTPNTTAAALEGATAAGVSNDTALAATDIGNTTILEGTLIYRTAT
jgi:hypothetical protein